MEYEFGTVKGRQGEEKGERIWMITRSMIKNPLINLAEGTAIAVEMKGKEWIPKRNSIGF